MEAYPPEYVEHSLPLVLLSGLGEPSPTEIGSPQNGNGTNFKLELPQCEGNKASQLLQQFLERDGSNQPWNSAALSGPNAALSYRMKAIGRTYTFLPRKAAPPPHSPSAEGYGSQTGSPNRSAELHSPLSPLSPGSPVFPDGVFTPLWFTKHQQQVPCLLLAFFDINAKAGSTQDEKLKSDINAVRTALSRSGFKTRLAVVLMSDSSILHAPQLEDRLTGIRRATTLDPKTGLFFMPLMSSTVEIGTFVQSVLTALQPSCVEYYRDLTKHARRKKARGYVPPPTAPPLRGASHTLETIGWNVRYEIKQGVFAEFRQEMDVAERHYSFAIDELFHPEGVFETTSSWLPRWTEARLLSDALALRVLRCQLWDGATSGAAKSWVNYKARLKDLIDRRGKGSQTYGWEAWEARWAKIMAQLIQRADLPAIKTSLRPNMDESTELTKPMPYAPPEKALAAAERLPPFHHLHHPGYWHVLSAKSSRARLKRALAIPDEDRMPPGQSPASAVANRTQVYDTYLVPDPHEEFPTSGGVGYGHIADIASSSDEAVRHFSSRGQGRMSEQMRLTLAVELFGARQFNDAMGVLVPLWQHSSWRGEDWHELFGDLLLTLYRCSQKVGSQELVLATTWELMSARFVVPPVSGLNLMGCLRDFDISFEGKVSVSFRDRERLSPISAEFAFSSTKGHVGEPLACQLALVSRAVEGSQPVVISSVHVLVGPASSITITHAANEELDARDDSLVQLTQAEDSGSQSNAYANLTLYPAQKRIFNLSMTPREARVTSVEHIMLTIDTEKFRIEHTFSREKPLAQPFWYQQTAGTLERWDLPHEDSSTVIVLPKPPKVQMLIHGLRKEYYVDERVRLTLELINEEAETVEGVIRQRVAGPDEHSLHSSWTQATGSDNESTGLTEQAVPSLDALASRKMGLQIYGPTEVSAFTLIVELEYTVASDHTIPLIKTLGLDLMFERLLEAKFNFGPLLHPEPWPSYFAYQAEGTESTPGGMLQRWRLASHVTSKTEERVFVKNVQVVTDQVAGDAACTISREESVETLQTLGANGALDGSFELITQKHALDDRRPIGLDLSLMVTWAREDSELANTTSLPMPRLTVPTAEPRVLCTATQADDEEVDICLQYHIENPSMHFLTFAVTMEASEDFAFRGPKYRTLSVAPLSRYQLCYGVMVHETDDGQESAEGWIRPSLQVLDSYYQKTLRVQAAGPGVKVDGQREIAVHVGKELG